MSRDDWLPETAARPHPVHYRQYLLYCDPRERYSVVSFVWGIGQRTPIHDHMTWGVIAMLRGAERAERYERAAPMRLLGESVLLPGDVDRVSPRLGDIHRVSNACDDRVSISIHIYGGNIGRIPRHVYDVDTARRAFVSGYANADAAGRVRAPGLRRAAGSPVRHRRRRRAPAHGSHPVQSVSFAARERR